jgi:Ca2+-binding EF-hand superfamily protein
MGQVESLTCFSRNKESNYEEGSCFQRSKGPPVWGPEDEASKTVETGEGNNDSLTGAAWAESVLANDKALAAYATKVFTKYDEDGNGKLGKGTAIQILGEICNDHGISPPKSKKVQELFHKCDKDKNGSIDVTEFTEFFRIALTSVVQRASVVGGS